MTLAADVFSCSFPSYRSDLTQAQNQLRTAETSWRSAYNNLEQPDKEELAAAFHGALQKRSHVISEAREGTPVDEDEFDLPVEPEHKDM